MTKRFRDGAATCPDCGGPRDARAKRCWSCAGSAKAKPVNLCRDCGVPIMQASVRCRACAGTEHLPLLERFHAKVEKHDADCSCCEGCWHWTGMRLKPSATIANGSGYGYLWVNGKMRRAHRLSHELFVGPIPEGLSVLHSCDRPWCVNPAHLRAGTLADNSRDCIQRGRHGNQWRRLTLQKGKEG